MSLASVYAALQTAASDSQDAANAATPAPYVGDPCTMSVSAAGSLVITPPVGRTTVEAISADALIIAAWIVTNFG